MRFGRAECRRQCLEIDVFTKSRTCDWLTLRGAIREDPWALRDLCVLALVHMPTGIGSCLLTRGELNG